MSDSRPWTLEGARVLSMDPEQPEIDDAVIVVEGDTIRAVGPRTSVKIPPDAARRRVDGHAVIPGLVNTHTHIPQILLRGGISSDRNLLEWLFTALYPGLAHYSAADIACAYRLYCLEALRAGVTTMLAHDHVGHTDYVGAAEPALRVLDETGMRVLYARMFSDKLPAGSSPDHIATLAARRPRVERAFVRRDTTKVLDDLHRLIGRFGSGGNDRIRVIPSPSTASAVSLQALSECARLAETTTGLWTLHVSETPQDRPDSVLSAIRFLDAHRLLSNRLIAGHCVHVDEVDIALLRRHDVAVSTQPVSNGVLGSGVAPLPAMLNAGLRIGLGTDDANCNDTVNPLADLKTLGVLQRAVYGDVGVVDAAGLLELATIGGARALGLGAITGSLQAGKRADFVVLDLRQPHLVPARDLAATLVWQANGSEIRDVVIDGRYALRNRQAVFLDGYGPHAEQELLTEAAERSGDLARRAGL